MIDEKATYEKFGYYSKDLKPKSHKKIVAVCDDCGNVRVLNKCDYRGLCKACAVTGEKHPNWKGGKVKRICEVCGTEFPIKPSDTKNGQGRFCSRKCEGKWRSKQFSGENSPSWKGGTTKRICQTCGTEFPVKPSDTKNGRGKFCTKKCMGIWYSKYQRGENSPTWQGGISFEPYCSKFNNELKEYIRDKFGRICFLCSKTEQENGRRLSVHHVNYNKDCGCDDDETCQFVPLCIGCNVKANHNRKMWEKKIKDKMKNKLNGWYI